jgi:deoxyadenosine/deoxycytidine kinase
MRNAKILDRMAKSTGGIAIVGPCGAGKTTLAEGLQKLGLDARQVAQEHSYVPAMWKLIRPPDMLIYLHVSFDRATIRKRFHWTEEEYMEQVWRLRHAREHCDLFIDTTQLAPGEILDRVLQYLGIMLHH